MNNLDLGQIFRDSKNDPLAKTVAWSRGPLDPSPFIRNQPGYFDSQTPLMAALKSQQAPGRDGPLFFLNRFTMICHPFDSIKNIFIISRLVGYQLMRICENTTWLCHGMSWAMLGPWQGFPNLTGMGSTGTGF